MASTTKVNYDQDPVLQGRWLVATAKRSQDHVDQSLHHNQS